MSESKKLTNGLLAALVALSLLFGILTSFGGGNSGAIVGAIGTKKIESYVPAVKYNEGIYTELPIETTSTFTSSGTMTLTGLLSAAAATFSSTLGVTGQTTLTGTTTTGVLDAAEFTQGGGIATLTDANGGAYTLSQTELLNNNVLAFAASGAGQEVIQLTFPATSSLPLIIPNAGDFRQWIYDASALAAATTTTITAGTGFDLIAVTTNDDVIDGAEFAEISCWRQADSDITCITSELLHSD